LLTGVLLALLAKGYQEILRQSKLTIIDFYKTKLSVFKKVKQEDLDRVLNKFEYSGHKHFYTDTNYETNLKTWLKNYPGKKSRPRIFMKVKPRKFVPWYALIDYVLLRELKYIGFIPCVMVYDIPYDIVNAGGEDIEIEELNELKNATKTYIKRIIGNGVEVLFSSEFFNKSSRGKVFHDQLFPYIINNFVEDDIKSSTSYSDRNEAQLQLLGFMSVVAVQILCNSSPTYVLQWEGRKNKWQNVDENIFLILNKTIKANGEHLNSNNCFRISSTKEETIKYLSTTDDVILKDELPAMFNYLAKDLKYIFSDRILDKKYDDLVELFRTWESMGLISSKKYASIINTEASNKPLNKFKSTFEEDESLHLANYKYTLIEELDNIKSRYNLITK
jgi:hypothetical protein